MKKSAHRLKTRVGLQLAGGRMSHKASPVHSYGQVFQSNAARTRAGSAEPWAFPSTRVTKITGLETDRSFSERRKGHEWKQLLIVYYLMSVFKLQPEVERLG